VQDPGPTVAAQVLATENPAPTVGALTVEEQLVPVDVKVNAGQVLEV
jgi:hypothetical protein